MTNPLPPELYAQLARLLRRAKNGRIIRRLGVIVLLIIGWTLLFNGHSYEWMFPAGALLMIFGIPVFVILSLQILPNSSTMTAYYKPKAIPHLLRAQQLDWTFRGKVLVKLKDVIDSGLYHETTGRMPTEDFFSGRIGNVKLDILQVTMQRLFRGASRYRSNTEKTVTLFSGWFIRLIQPYGSNGNVWLFSKNTTPDTPFGANLDYYRAALPNGEVTIGDAAFDQQFFVFTNSASLPGKLLTPEKRKQLLAVRDGFRDTVLGISFVGNAIYLMVDLEYDPMELTFNGTLDDQLRDHLREIGRLSETVTLLLD